MKTLLWRFGFNHFFPFSFVMFLWTLFFHIKNILLWNVANFITGGFFWWKILMRHPLLKVFCLLPSIWRVFKKRYQCAKRGCPIKLDKHVCMAWTTWHDLVYPSSTLVWPVLLVQVLPHPQLIFPFKNLVLLELIWIFNVRITLKSISPTVWIQILPDKFY